MGAVRLHTFLSLRFSLFGSPRWWYLFLLLFSQVSMFLFIDRHVILNTFAVGLAFRHFMLRRISFAAHLTASQSALTTSRYLRLMLMASLQMVWSLTLTAYSLWFNIMAGPLRPWTSWNDVHSDFSRIDTYATVFTPLPILIGYYVLWWMVPISTLIFVVFFAFGKDAVEEYKRGFLWFRSRVLRRFSSSDLSSKSGFANILDTR